MKEVKTPGSVGMYLDFACFPGQSECQSTNLVILFVFRFNSPGFVMYTDLEDLESYRRIMKMHIFSILKAVNHTANQLVAMIAKSLS
ncbi:hypothetical protein AKJ16_DCAP24895 [Drosera capensis]